MKKLMVHSALNVPRVKGLVCKTESMTKQAMRDECDVNNIISSFRETGRLPDINEKQKKYGYAPAIDFREAMEIVTESKRVFNSLPASIRTRFGNNPELFLQFAENPENLNEMVSMGLAEKRDTPARETEEKPGEGNTGPLEENSSSSAKPNGPSGGEPSEHS